MLKLREEQITLWDSIIPKEIWSLPEELAKVDALLDDERFMQPFLEKHHTRRGRPIVSVFPSKARKARSGANTSHSFGLKTCNDSGLQVKPR